MLSPHYLSMGKFTNSANLFHSSEQRKKCLIYHCDGVLFGLFKLLEIHVKKTCDVSKVESVFIWKERTLIVA